MKVLSKVMVVVTIAVPIVVAVAVFSARAADQAAAAAPTTTVAAQAKAQTECPVMGGKINKSIFADYQGKRVYFCCNMCPAQFKKDPEKYIKAMEAKGIVLDKTPATADGK